MSALKEKLHADMSTAMKARDDVRLRTLRMALTAVSNEEVSGKQARELTDEEVQRILVREAKKRREAGEAFAAAGRAEQAAAERAEGDVLAEYLPAQMSDEELAAIIDAAITETGAAGPRGIGQVMKVVKPKIGDSVEGGRLAAEIKRRLGA